MKISALRLFNVRRFANQGVAIEQIGDGVNVLTAANEHGKSTSFEALHALFFQPHTSLSGEVKALRPYAGGNPIVEADVATAEGAFRITKQFLGTGKSARVVDRASGRLIAQADEAEAFIARLLGGPAAGPAGLLWVRQGVTGMERRAKAEEEEERRVRQSLVESVQGEVEAVTGGRRMAAIMARVQDDLDLLVTATGRPKAKERYALAIEERDALAEAERKLAAEVTALRAALDERNRKAALLADLERPEEKARLRAQLEKAEHALDMAKRQDGEIRFADAAATTAREARQRAEAALADYRGLLGEVAGLAERRTSLTAASADADRRARALAATIAEARRRLDEAETAERVAREGLDRLAMAEKARLAAERQAALEARLEKAEALRRAVEEGEAALRALQLPAKDVAALAELDVALATMRVAELSARPSLAIRYEPGAPAITVDGVALGEGAVLPIGSDTEIGLPGIGTLELRIPEAGRRDAGIGKKEEERRALLGRLGVADLAAARQRQQAADDRKNALAELTGALRQLAPDGLDRLREEVMAGRQAAAGKSEHAEGDVETLRAALADAEARRLAARTAEREAEAPLAAAVKALREAEAALAAIDARIEQAGQRLGAEAERPAREAALADAFVAADRRFSEALAALEKLRAAAVDLQTAEAELARARSAERGAQAEAARLGEEISQLRGLIKARTEEAVEENWREVSEKRASAEARVAAFEKEVAVLTRLKSALDDARSAARELYLKPVMSELQPLLGLLFEDATITFDEKTLLPQRIMRGGVEEDVERLSGGMREQLSVLTRLAFARLLARDGRPAPVILDDALVYSDDDRIEKMFTALHRQSRDQQIIVFSCRQRAFRSLGGTPLTMVDWTPG